VLLPETDLAGAVELEDALRVAVRALELKHMSELGIVTISIGAAAIRPRQQQGTGEALVHAADQALYRAKAAGRDRVCSPIGAALANSRDAPPAPVIKPKRAVGDRRPSADV